MSARFRPVIRVFVSSTFSDLKEERNALQREVFPRLEHYCLVRGFQFQAIDLRWGVPGDAGRDHRTMQICFEELRRAQEVSPRPNFLVLLGDRYGWQPLTESLTNEEFAKLEAAAARIDQRDPERELTATEALRTWYRRDNNADPVEYVLRSRYEWPDRGAWEDENAEKRGWEVVEQALWDVINEEYRLDSLEGRFASAGKTGSPPPAIVKFQGSATEQEIWRGALAVPDAPEHVVAWYRTIQNREVWQHDKRAGDYFDSKEALQAPAADLRNELMRRLHRDRKPDIQPVEVELKESANGEKLEVTRDHLQPMCDEIEARLREIVDEEIRAYWRPLGASGAPAPPGQSGPSEARKLQLEEQAHWLFGESRAPKDGFVGRDLELRAIEDYLRDENDSNPLVVHGPSGTGKTALLARAAQAAKIGKRRIIVRFLGTTPQSSNLLSLLASLCRSLRSARKTDKDSPSELYKVQEEFDQLLAQATADKPILLFLDALDQLEGGDGARQTYWLRTPLPPHVKVVVSCIRDEEGPSGLNEAYRFFERRKLLDRAIAVESLTATDAIRAIILWLQHDNRRPGRRRRLTQQQLDSITERITPDSTAACRRPLYLRILFEECRLWPSWKPIQTDELGKDTSALLNALFTRLSQPAVHGALLVEAALSYIASARRGLSESEILEVLWADPDYRRHLNEVSRKTQHELPVEATRIPIAFWSRLRYDLDPYLAEHGAPGGIVLSFYHREVSRFVANYYLKESGARYRHHHHLAEYFQSERQPWWREPGYEGWSMDPRASERQPNVRKADELPQQWIWTADSSRRDGFDEENRGAYETVESLFQCLSLLEVKVAAGMIFDLIADYDAATRVIPDERPNRRTLVLLRRALRRDASAIVMRPHLLLQFLWHTCYWHDSPLTAQYFDSKGAMPAHSALLPWNEPGPKLFELMERWVEESRREGPNRRPWLRSQHPSGVPLISPLAAILRGHTGSVLSVALTSDGRRMVSGSSDGTVRLWEIESATERAVLRGHTAAVNGVAISSDGRRIVSASNDKTVRIWDTETGTQVGILHGSWLSERFGLGGVYLDPGTLTQHSVSASAEPHQGFSSVAITPDGRRIVCGSEDDIRILDSESGEGWKIDYVWFVHSVAVTQDGETIVSDGRFDIWSLDLKSRASITSLWEPGPSVSEQARQVLVWGKQKSIPVAILKAQESPRTNESRYSTSYSAKPLDRIAIAVTPDGRCIVGGSTDGTIRVWHSYDTEPASLNGPKEGVTSVAVTSDGTRIVGGAGDKTVRVWDSKNGAELAVLRGHESEVTSVAVTPDGESICSGSADNTIRLWSMEHIESLAAQYEFKRDKNKDTTLPVGNGTVVMASSLGTDSRWACNKVATLVDGRRIAIEFKEHLVLVWEAHTRILQALFPVDPRFDEVSLTSNGRELELMDKDSETVVYSLDISTPNKRKMTLTRVARLLLGRILGLQQEDIPLTAPAKTRTDFDFSETILQGAMRWAFGTQADGAEYTAKITPIAELYWPGCSVKVLESREDAVALSSGVAIPCIVEAGASVFNLESKREAKA
jgi:WD40 repeat protein